MLGVLFVIHRIHPNLRYFQKLLHHVGGFYIVANESGAQPIANFPSDKILWEVNKRALEEVHKVFDNDVTPFFRPESYAGHPVASLGWSEDHEQHDQTKMTFSLTTYSPIVESNSGQNFVIDK